MTGRAASLLLLAVLGLTACDGPAPIAPAEPEPRAAASPTPLGPVPTRDPSMVRLSEGDDPLWCGPVVTATVLQPSPEAVTAGDPDALARAAEVAEIAAGAALEPDVPAVVASYLEDTAALNRRLVETGGRLEPADDALGADLIAATPDFYDAVEPACDDTIAGLQ